ncbi:Tellurite resistance protein [Tistlia consotensis]|uniref:Tellurite resistance protein n=1 Tax=Tistlia consotensis USBA 355 TaxID=560819 RepID=A0A1Y6BMK0_9PROT|nr:tellurite resistance TerB family protein [Tistlia consotensis]SMF08471.1 Tellurite resistance protein [Tistlia consotensis USBA 355]SNR35372.1 Tellurite resistance protein [Tistlia consotensis]
MSQQLDAHSALIYTMVLASAADSEMTSPEVGVMSEIIKLLPVFKGYDLSKLSSTAAACAELLADENGLDEALDRIDRGLPEKLRETAYALAVDVVAADGTASQEELRLLEMLRHKIGVGRLEAAAIERGAGARYRKL